MDLNLEKNYEDYRIREYEILKKNTESGIKICVFIVCVFEVVAIFMLYASLMLCEVGEGAGVFGIILSIVIGGGMFLIGMASVREDLYDLRKLEENLGIKKCRRKQDCENCNLL